VLTALHGRLANAETDTIQIKAHYLDVDETNMRIGQAIGRLANRDDFDIEIDRWTAPTTNPVLWEVSR